VHLSYSGLFLLLTRALLSEVWLFVVVILLLYLTFRLFLFVKNALLLHHKISEDNVVFTLHVLPSHCSACGINGATFSTKSFLAAAIRFLVLRLFLVSYRSVAEGD